MEILGIELAGADLRALLGEVRDFALPRAGITAGLLLLAAVLHRLGRGLLDRLGERVVTRTDTRIDDAVFQAVRRGILLSIWFWAGWRIALAWELEGTGRGVVAAWIVALSFPLARLTSDILEVVERRARGVTTMPLDQTALPLLNRIVHFVIVAVGVLVALEFVGVSVTPLLAGAGVAGLAVSLAAKDTLSNLIAGVLLILDRPFQVGDRIELWTVPGETGSWGDVVEIGLRATKIRNPDNLIIVIPNNEIMRRDIVNYTASGDHIRLRIPFGIAYDADMRTAKRLILECAEEISGVKAVPGPEVIVRSFGDSSVNLELRVWIDDARRRRAVGDQVTERVKEAFNRHGIEIPYPKRDLYLKATPEAGAPGPALRPPPPEPRPPEGDGG